MNGKNPPSTLAFEMLRRATGGTPTLTATLVAGSDPVRYEAQWNVTQEKGRWEIKTQGYVSNTVQFKIDKREQIDHLANSYVGAPRGSAGAGSQCEHFVGAIYTSLGLAICADTVSNLGGGYPPDFPLANSAHLQDTKGYGCVTLFQGNNKANAYHWQHAAIKVGGSVVDQNCGSPVANPPNSNPS